MRRIIKGKFIVENAKKKKKLKKIENKLKFK